MAASRRRLQLLGRVFRRRREGLGGRDQPLGPTVLLCQPVQRLQHGDAPWSRLERLGIPNLGASRVLQRPLVELPQLEQERRHLRPPKPRQQLLEKRDVVGHQRRSARDLSDLCPERSVLGAQPHRPRQGGEGQRGLPQRLELDLCDSLEHRRSLFRLRLGVGDGLEREHQTLGILVRLVDLDQHLGGLSPRAPAQHRLQPIQRLGSVRAS